MLVFEIRDVFGFGPLAGRLFLKLHEAEFLGAAPHPGMEPALAPDDGFDERRLDAVTPRRRADRPILAPLQPPFPPPIPGESSREEQGRNEQPQ